MNDDSEASAACWACFIKRQWVVGPGERSGSPNVISNEIQVKCPIYIWWWNLSIPMRILVSNQIGTEPKGLTPESPSSIEGKLESTYPSGTTRLNFPSFVTHIQCTESAAHYEIVLYLANGVNRPLADMALQRWMMFPSTRTRQCWKRLNRCAVVSLLKTS